MKDCNVAALINVTAVELRLYLMGSCYSWYNENGYLSVHFLHQLQLSHSTQVAGRTVFRDYTVGSACE